MLKQRHLEIPRAEKIVEVFIERFLEWKHVYQHRDLIISYKEKIQNFIFDYKATHKDVAGPDHIKKVEKTFSGLIQQIKSKGYAGCMVIEAMNDLVPSEK